MIAFIAGRMMELEVEGLTGAAHGERSPTRINQRVSSGNTSSARHGVRLRRRADILDGSTGERGPQTALNIRRKL